MNTFDSYLVGCVVLFPECDKTREGQTVPDYR
jgi:hypothetical protein